MTEKTGDGTESSHWGELEPMALGEKQCIMFIIAIEVKDTLRQMTVFTRSSCSHCSKVVSEKARKAEFIKASKPRDQPLSEPLPRTDRNCSVGAKSHPRATGPFFSSLQA